MVWVIPVCHHNALVWAIVLLSLAFFRGCSCSQDPERKSQASSESDKQEDSTPATPEADSQPAQPPNSSNSSEGSKAAAGEKAPEKSGGSGNPRSAFDTVKDIASSFSARKRDKAPVSPAQAHRQASDLLGAAERSASDGDYGEAYSQALTAWQMVSPHSKQDSKCKALEQALFAHLKRYGEEANQQVPATEASSKPLVVR